MVQCRYALTALRGAVAQSARSLRGTRAVATAECKRDRSGIWKNDCTHRVGAESLEAALRPSRVTMPRTGTTTDRDRWQSRVLTGLPPAPVVCGSDPEGKKMSIVVGKSDEGGVRVRASDSELTTILSHSSDGTFINLP